MDAYWQAAGSALDFETSPDIIRDDPSTAITPAAADYGDGIAKAVPSFSRFWHAGSRPTHHEWEKNMLESGDYALRGCAECLGPAGVPGPFHEVTNDRS